MARDARVIQHAEGQVALFYYEAGQIIGAFIGVPEGDGVFLSYSIMSQPGAFLPALIEALAFARTRWTHVTFCITDDHPYCGTLARLATRYKAEPVDHDADGVYYRIQF